MLKNSVTICPVIERIFLVLNEQFANPKSSVFGHYSYRFISFNTEQLVLRRILPLPRKSLRLIRIHLPWFLAWRPSKAELFLLSRCQGKSRHFHWFLLQHIVALSKQSWGQSYKTFFGRNQRIFVKCQAKGPPQSGEPERCFIRVSSGLTHKHQTRLERLAGDKHSSLLRKSVNYDYNFFKQD